jgi:hypothetical protein
VSGSYRLGIGRSIREFPLDTAVQVGPAAKQR